MRFSDIPGQEHVKERLRQMADADSLPHALLLQGAAGCYKLALIRALAQYVHCTARTADGDSCGRCPACLQHQGQNHIDTVYVYPVVKRPKLDKPTADDYAEQWREFCHESPGADIELWTAMLDKKGARPGIYVAEAEQLLHKLSLTSHRSRYKIVILWLPERMNEDAANKLLKIIEEPHDGTIFLMASDNAAEVLPTVYSRLQRIDVPALNDDAITRILMQTGNDTIEHLRLAARLAEGNVNRAIAIASGAGTVANDDNSFIELMRLAYQRKVAELKTWAKNLAEEGRDAEVRFYENAQRLVRENFIYNYGNKDLNYMTAEEEQFSSRFARFIHEGNVEKLIKVFNEAQRDIAGNGAGTLINFDVALKVCFLLRINAPE